MTTPGAVVRVDGIDRNAPGALGPELRLPALIERARGKLAEAHTAAEALEAKHVAEAALHYAKVTGAANEAHADCLRIITRAEVRISLEYRAAQERGEVASRKDGPAVRDHVQTMDKVAPPPPTLGDLGLDRRRLHEFDSLAQAGEATIDHAIDEAADEAAAKGRKVTKAAVKRKVAAKSKRKVQTPKWTLPPRPPQLTSLSLWLRRGAEIAPEFTTPEEAAAMAHTGQVILESAKIDALIEFLTRLRAALAAGAQQ